MPALGYRAEAIVRMLRKYPDGLTGHQIAAAQRVLVVTITPALRRLVVAGVIHVGLGQANARGGANSVYVIAPRSGGLTRAELGYVRLLLDGPRCAAGIADELGQSYSNALKRLKALHRRGITALECKDRTYIHTLTPGGLAATQALLGGH